MLSTKYYNQIKMASHSIPPLFSSLPPKLTKTGLAIKFGGVCCVLDKIELVYYDKVPNLSFWSKDPELYRVWVRMTSGGCVVGGQCTEDEALSQQIQILDWVASPPGPQTAGETPK